MGVDLQTLAVGVADAVVLAHWFERAKAVGAPGGPLNRASTATMQPYLLALGATYELVEPKPPSIKRAFPELDVRERAAIWDGRLPAGITRERADAFNRAEIAYAQTHDQKRSGTPAFKLADNGPPWHVTRPECEDLIRITATDPDGERDPDPDRRGREVWEIVEDIFVAGVAADGVLVL